MFALRNEGQAHYIFNRLMTFALGNGKTPPLFSIAFWDWYRRLMDADPHFSLWEQVVVLESVFKPNIVNTPRTFTGNVSPIKNADLAELFTLDQLAFPPPWRLGKHNLSNALSDSKIALKSTVEGNIVGYLLATYDLFNAHLSRIAVHPDYIKKGLASSLMATMLQLLHEESLHTITVNTQESNIASLRLYQIFGFQLTGEKIPVFRYNSPETEVQ